MLHLKKAYYLLFYKIQRFFEGISDDGWSEWKALLVVSVTQILLITELLIWIVILNKWMLDIHKYWIGLIGFLITFVNYHLLFHMNIRIKYEEEFKYYSKKKNKMISWLSFLFLVAVLGSLIFAFYRMSFIDWSMYR